MNKKSSIFTMSGAALGFLLLTACGGGGAMVEDDSAEYQAYLYRDSLMTLAANRMALIGGMAREEIPLDEEAFIAATAQLAALATMNLDGFENQTIVAASRTLPAVWENWEDFQQKNADFVEATQGLADAAADGGFSAAQGLVQGTAGTCGGCHRTYREREE
jgi:cytochrome c556